MINFRTSAVVDFLIFNQSTVIETYGNFSKILNTGLPAKKGIQVQKIRPRSGLLLKGLPCLLFRQVFYDFQP